MVNFPTPWRKDRAPAEHATSSTPPSSNDDEKDSPPTRKWNLGILSDPLTDEVPGSVILLSKTHNRNEPLGLRHARARTSASSLPSPYEGPPQTVSRSRQSSRSRSFGLEKKRTKDGKFILDPQPEDSANDPLNWRPIRRDVALISLGLYCMIGGGQTPILAAAFTNVAQTYHVTTPQVALTTGLYMLGMGLGSVFASPTAILYGKRPVYLVASILFVLSSVWCALSPSYSSLVVARIVQGFSVSPVECLPSATIAEIFFLHERAYRLGIYTLLLLGGKNLVPLVSAAITQSLGWRWIFWVVAMFVGMCFFLIFFFIPETFWDRRPLPPRRHGRSRSASPSRHHHLPHHLSHLHLSRKHSRKTPNDETPHTIAGPSAAHLASPQEHHAKRHKVEHVGFADVEGPPRHSAHTGVDHANLPTTPRSPHSVHFAAADSHQHEYFSHLPHGNDADEEKTKDPDTKDAEKVDIEKQDPLHHKLHLPSDPAPHEADHISEQLSIRYTDFLRSAPPKSYRQSLKLWNGRLVKDKWIKVAIRPFILFAYPSILWSTLVYSLGIGWLIVISESIAEVYRNKHTYNFTALQVGLVYISPFIGGILGTAVAGKFSDIIVRFMARKNDGVYEPEFRLVMAIPITICTVIGLMGFGWSAQERDLWIVPTVFFGVISFGCSLASTTAITFAVDSYRAYAGEALVTLNFSKNLFHGFVFSLFFPHWLQSDGAKRTFIGIGCIQLVCMISTIPMYIYGKRARMWTVRKNFMEKF